MPPRRRKLVLLRHAKSNWDDPALDDHERPLSSRGIRAAALLGAYLPQRGLQPSLVLCSTARRALETLDGLRSGLPDDATVQIERELYLASADSLLESLRDAPDTAHTVLLVGHNPGIEQLASELLCGGSPAAMRRMRSKFPTAALAELDVALERWRDLQRGSADLVEFCTPKDLV